MGIRNDQTGIAPGEAMTGKPADPIAQQREALTVERREGLADEFERTMEMSDPEFRTAMLQFVAINYKAILSALRALPAGEPQAWAYTDRDGKRCATFDAHFARGIQADGVTIQPLYLAAGEPGWKPCAEIPRHQVVRPGSTVSWSEDGFTNWFTLDIPPLAQTQKDA